MELVREMSGLIAGSNTAADENDYVDDEEQPAIKVPHLHTDFDLEEIMMRKHQ